MSHHPAIAAWEALPWEDRAALLGMLEEEAAQHRRDATGGIGCQYPEAGPEMRERYAVLAKTWETARAALQRPDTVTSKDRAPEDYEAEKAAAVPMSGGLDVSEVLLLAAWDAYPDGVALTLSKAQVIALAERFGRKGLVSGGDLTEAGRALLDRALKEGVL